MADRVRSRVVLYSASGCHLCDRALEVVREVCGEDFELISIDGVAELESTYRELVPVVEVDGEHAFTYYVQPEALRERLEWR